VQAAHGRNAVAFYQGNPVVHNHGAILFGQYFQRSLGSRSRYSATSVDQLPQMLASLLMFGHQLLLPIPDVDRTDFLLVLGANPLVSNGSLLTAPASSGGSRSSGPVAGAWWWWTRAGPRRRRSPISTSRFAPAATRSCWRRSSTRWRARSAFGSAASRRSPRDWTCWSKRSGLSRPRPWPAGPGSTRPRSAR
jgi:hypothetical protein